MSRPVRSKYDKILVIQDKEEDYLLIKEALQLGFTGVLVTRAASGQEALTRLEEWILEEWELPSLILQDLYLPQSEDGLALLSRIKEMPAPCNRIPIIVLSPLKAHITEAYQLGANSYCLKPTESKGWAILLEAVRVYWFETATLPAREVIF